MVGVNAEIRASLFKAIAFKGTDEVDNVTASTAPETVVYLLGMVDGE